MKIHMDYLEGKVEQFQNQMTVFDREKLKLQRQAEHTQDKYQLYRDQKDREVRELTKKLTDGLTRINMEKEKNKELETRLVSLEEEKEMLANKYHSVHQSMDFKSVDSSGFISTKKSNNKGKSLPATKEQSLKNHLQTLSGSKTATHDAKGQQMAWN